MTTLHRIVGGLVAVVLAAGVVACDGEPSGGRPSRDEIIAKIKADPETAGTPDKAAGCIADWYLTYASDQELTALMDDKPGGGMAEVAQSPKAKEAILDCVKKATDNS